MRHLFRRLFGVFVGIRLTEPHRGWTAIPYKGVVLADQEVPGHAQAEAMCLAAGAALPGIPMIGWDVLLTSEDLVVLEANTGLLWRLMHLRHALDGTASELCGIIRQGIEAADAGSARERPRSSPSRPE